MSTFAHEVAYSKSYAFKSLTSDLVFLYSSSRTCKLPRIFSSKVAPRWMVFAICANPCCVNVSLDTQEMGLSYSQVYRKIAPLLQIPLCLSQSLHQGLCAAAYFYMSEESGFRTLWRMCYVHIVLTILTIAFAVYVCITLTVSVSQTLSLVQVDSTYSFSYSMSNILQVLIFWGAFCISPIIRRSSNSHGATNVYEENGGILRRHSTRPSRMSSAAISVAPIGNGARQSSSSPTAVPTK